MLHIFAFLLSQLHINLIKLNLIDPCIRTVGISIVIYARFFLNIYRNNYDQLI